MEVVGPDSPRVRYSLDPLLAELGWQPARSGPLPNVAIEFRDGPLERGAVQPDGRKRLVIGVSETPGEGDTTALVYAVRTDGEVFDLEPHVLGPTHIVEAVIDALVRGFLEAVDAAEPEPRELSKMLEGLLAAIQMAVELTEELARRDAELEQLREELEALRVLTRSLERQLTKRRLGQIARVGLDVALGVLASRIDAALFRDVQQAVQPVIAQCENIINQLNVTVEIG